MINLLHKKIKETDFNDKTEGASFVYYAYTTLTGRKLNTIMNEQLVSMLYDPRLNPEICAKIFLDSITAWLEVEDQKEKMIFVYFKKIFQNKINQYVLKQWELKKEEEKREALKLRAKVQKTEITEKQKEIIAVNRLYKTNKNKFNADEQQLIEAMLNQGKTLSARNHIEKRLNKS